MQYRQIIYLLACCIFGIARAQTPAEIHGPGASISISPLALIDVYNGSSVRIGTEWRIAGKNSVYGEAGYFLPQSPFSVHREMKGYTFRGEYKRYFALGERGAQGQQRLNHYLSATYFYKFQDYLYPDTFATGQEMYYPVTKHIHAFSVRYGAVLEGKRCVVDLYVGLGIRHKNTDLGISKQLQDERVIYNDSQSEYFSQTETKSFWPNFDAGIRLGVKLFE